jgi:hypothetical protein
MKLDESLERALRGAEPIQSLRSFAKELFSQGKDEAAVLAVFEQARQQLREAGRETDEDAVMEVMDFLVGWCSPHMKMGPNNGANFQANGPTLSRAHGQPIQEGSEEPRP